MNKAELSILNQQAKRLMGMAETLAKESRQLAAMTEQALINEEVKAIPRADTDLSEEEASRMVLEASAIQKGLLQLNTDGEANFFPLGAMVLGPDGLLARYLSKEIFVYGKGVLKPGSLLKSYEDDIFTAPAATMLLWNSGFYRNRTNGSQQLLLRAPNRNSLLRIGGLPWLEGDSRLYVILETNILTQHSPATPPTFFRIDTETVQQQKVVRGVNDEALVVKALAEVEELMKSLQEVAVQTAA